MKNGWEDWRAKCPFYGSETAFSIRCAGWEPGMHMKLTFSEREACAGYKKEICKTEDGFLTCPLYDMLSDMQSGK